MSVFKKAKTFKSKFPMTVAWRLRKNADIIEKHLNADEKVQYVFVGQKNNVFYDLFSTAVIAITSERILIGRKRVVFGYALDSVMPYMFNDVNIRAGLLWGTVTIDTAKELIVMSNIDKKALTEIEKNISSNMIRLKKMYPTTKEEK